MTRCKTIFKLGRFAIQLNRERSGRFSRSLVMDIAMAKVMVAEVTVFGISFVYWGG
jgi:hypothetical protein